MKKLTLIAAAFLFVGTASAQTATQNVTLEVKQVAKLSVAGSPTLVIDEANATEDGLEVVTDNGSSYNRVNNFANAKITAQIDQNLGAGFGLNVNFVEDGAGAVDIANSNGAAIEVVTGLGRGATGNGTLTYEFSATPAAGTLSSQTRQVTYTLTSN